MNSEAAQSGEHSFQAIHLIAELRVGGVLLPVTPRDLDVSAICFLSERALVVGERYELCMALELGRNRYSEALVLRIRVAWVTQLNGAFQIGAAFELDEATQDDLRSLCYLVDREISTGEQPVFRTGHHRPVDVD